MLKEKLINIAGIIYKEEDLNFALSLYNEIVNLKLDDKLLAVAFFVRADTENKKISEEIKVNYGEDVLKNIELLQRIGRVSFPDSQKLIANLRKLFIQLTDNLALIFVKLYERLTTLKEADRLKSKNLKQIAEECLYLYSPIAHRLGIRKIYTDMEDISFRILYPEEFKRLSKAIEKKRAILESKLRDLSVDLKLVLQKNQINATIQKRVKRLYSIFRKIRNKGVSIDEIFDLMALRVVTNSIDNCYLALGVVHRNWLPIENRFRDWITYPKANGYRSIQTTVLTKNGDKYEIQIRTQEMHHEAEYGSAAHWAYKEGLADAETWIAKLKEFLENDEYFQNPHEFLEIIKSEMKSSNIHVLTPKGEIKSLPKGSTPIDYAYSVHSEVGNKITGARVNGKFANLRTELHSGDVVEVITSKNAKPSRDWLNYVKTSRARSKIRDWFQKNERNQIIADGKKIWEKSYKEYKKYLDKVDFEQLFRNNIAKNGYKTPEDFYFALGSKTIKSSSSLWRKLFPEIFRDITIKRRNGREQKRKGFRPLIQVEGMKDIETKFAQCCHPIKGESIIAYVTKTSGIKIHSSRCPYIKSGFLDSSNFKMAEWLDDDSFQNVGLEIFGYDMQKVQSAAVDIANNEKIIINSTEFMHFNALEINLQIKDYNQLQSYIGKLKSYSFIDTVVIV